MPKPDDDGQRSLFKEPKKGRPPKEPMIYIVPATQRASRCTGPNCHKVVYWIRVAGRPVIVDCEPIFAANHKKTPLQPHPSAPKCFPPVHPQAPGKLYGHGSDGQGIDHHATCHDVAQFGRKTERKNA